MSWLEKLLPPKIQKSDAAERRQMPEGLWIKCPACETVLYKTDLEQNQNVCPNCGHHHRIGARDPVSYTHLDVYKRQSLPIGWAGCRAAAGKAGNGNSSSCR